MPSLDAALPALTLSDAADAIAARYLSAADLAEAELARVRETEPVLHAFACLDPARVRRVAAESALRKGLLQGIGIGVKDVIDTADLPTEVGTPLMAGRRPGRSAACVERLEAAGGYVFGKTVTTAFAFLDPGATTNPWNPAHTPGGSSSGSAAAVAAGVVTGALGTQTNGSVIRPAAFCGVVGFKPTVGLLDFTGVHVFSATFDTLGTFTRTVRDAARLASVLAPASAIAPLPGAQPQAPRLAFLSAFPWCAPNAEAADVLAAAAVRLRMQGAVVTPVSFPDAWGDAHRIHRLIMLYEGARALAALQAAHRAQFSPMVNAALDEGHAIAEPEYRAALAHREQAIEYFTEWLAPYDAVIAPPATGAAPRGLASTGDPGCCTMWSLTGFPALSLPIGFDAAGLPLGLQLAAASHRDDALLATASWCETALGFAPRIAPVQARGA